MSQAARGNIMSDKQSKIVKQMDSEEQLLPPIDAGSSSSSSSSSSTTNIDSTNAAVSAPHSGSSNVLLFGEVNLAANFPSIKKLNSTEYTEFKEWKASASTYFGQHGFQELITKPVHESLALAVNMDTSGKGSVVVRNLYLRLHRKVCYLIRAAVESAVGENFFSDIEAQQIHAASEAEFYLDNSRYLWKKLCDKYEKRMPHDTARVVNELLFLKYNTSEHPKDMKKKFLELEKELRVMGIIFHPDVLAVLWMNAIPASLSVLKQGLQSRSSLNWEDVYAAIQTNYADKALNLNSNNKRNVNSNSDGSSGSETVNVLANHTHKFKSGNNKFKSKQYGNSNSNSITCSYCGKNGHEESRCWKKHGKPSNNSQHTSASTKGKGTKDKDSHSTEFSALLYQSNDSEELSSFSQSDAATHIDVAHPVVGELEIGRRNQFIIDSGASRHVTPHREIFSNIEKVPPVRLISALKSGTCVVTEAGTIKLNDRWKLNNVAYIPNAGPNLISEPCLADAGFTIVKDREECRIIYKGRIVLKFPRLGRLWIYTSPSVEKQSVPYHPTLQRTDIKSINKPSGISKPSGNSKPLGASNISAATTPISPSSSTVSTNYLNELCYSFIDGNADSKASSRIDLWHSRIGHQGVSVLKEANEVFKLGIPQNEIKSLAESCKSCIKGKAVRTAITSHADQQYKAVEPLQTVHADLVGPISVRTKDGMIRSPSFGGHVYALVMVDEFTHLVMVRLLTSKSEAADAIISILKQQQVRTGRTVQRFHSDGGTEFNNATLREFLQLNGTRFTHTTPSTPQHNGLVERMNRTLFDMVRTLLIQSSAPYELWGEALIWSAHLYNSTPQPTVKGTPYQLCYNYKFNLNKLKIFGCDAQVKLLPHQQSKLQSRTWTGTFVGFDTETNSYRILDLLTKRIVKTNDVYFNENSFLNLRSINSPRDSVPTIIQSSTEQVQPTSESDTEINVAVRQAEIMTSNANNIAPSAEEQVKLTSESDSEELDLTEVNIEDTESVSASVDVNEEEKYAESPTISRELRNLQQWTVKEQKSVEANLPTTRSGRARYTSQSADSNLNNYYSEDQKNIFTSYLSGNYSPSEFILYTQFSNLFEPVTYQQAINSDDSERWLSSMQDEINSMNKFKVWSYVQCPPDIKPIEGRWVFKNKLGDDNKLLKRKARFVAKGFLQVYGRDYLETHSPVAKMKSIKLLLSIVSRYNMELKQIDFDTAFLNATVEEDIYMKQPEGFHVGGPNTVCKLNKAIYGLKQASRQWNKLLDDFMINLGYKSLKTDCCVYIKYSKTNNLMLLCLYVDDTVIAYHKQDEAEWHQDKQIISNSFAIKDLGDCEWILNMKVTRDRKNRVTTLSQEAYVKRILEQFGMIDSKSVVNPSKCGDFLVPLDKTDVVVLDKTKHDLYRSIIGALMYAANTTRIDIAHVVGQLSRFAAAPCEHHLDAAKHVLRYLRGTSSLGLVFGSNNSGSSSPSSLTLIAYSDANWGGDSEDRKSTTGTIIKFNGDVISWLSKKQSTVSLSSSEAEYMALSTSTCEILWYQMWIQEVFKQKVVGTIYCDNQAAIYLSNNDGMHGRSKHIDIRHHFIRDHVYNKNIVVQYVNTKDQQADLLTKMLGTNLFNSFRERLMCVC